MELIFIEASAAAPVILKRRVGTAFSGLPRIGEMITIGERTYLIHNLIWNYSVAPIELRYFVL